MNQLFAELRRRNVFRVAAAYLVVGWIVMQVVSVMTPALELPDWVDGFFAILLMVGLPIALLLAWAFEMTPAGVQKTKAVDGDVEMRPLGSTDFVLIGLMVIVLGGIGFQMFSGNSNVPVTIADNGELATTPITDIETIQAPVIEASIAVLPFADFSQDGDQQYFSDGISEELLNALAQFPDLRVTARTSAFSFRGEVDLREVGEALGVAHVLEGSVRHSGDRIRITAQLIRVSDGFHLWSETYERTMTDVFEIQDEIVTELSRVLQVRLGVGAGSGRASSRDIDPLAYEQYLRGLSLWADRNDRQNRWNAVQSFARSTEIDPGFSDAWASYGVSLIASNLTDFELPQEEGNRLGFEALTRALELDPDNARAHAGLAVHYSQMNLNIDLALEHGLRAREIAPNAAYSNYFLAVTLFISGDVPGMLRAYDRALSIDRLNDLPVQQFAVNLARLDRLATLRSTLNACQHCDDGYREFLLRTATLQSGTEAEARAALADFSRFVMDRGDGTPQSIEQNEANVLWITDIAEVLLGTPNRGQIAASRTADGQGDAEDATVLAHMGNDELAIDILFNLHQAGRTPDGLDYIIYEGRHELPDRTLRHPRYHEFWQLPGMARLAEVRRANGQTAGLPLPMEPAE